MVPEVPAALHGDRQHHAIWPPAVAGDDLELLAATLATAAPAEVTSTVGALSDRELPRQTSMLVRHKRHLQGAVIDHLAEIDARRLYLQRGCSSLFAYAVRELAYSDAAAARRIGAVRLCADQPGARERLRDGSLTLSAAAELQRAFDRQRRRESISGTAPAATRGSAPAGAKLRRRQAPRQRARHGRSLRHHRTIRRRIPRRPCFRAAPNPLRRWCSMPQEGGSSCRRPPARARARSAACWPIWTRRWRYRPTGCAPRRRPLRAEGGHRRRLPAGLEQLRGLLSHINPRMTTGQIVGRIVLEALDRHDPSRTPHPERTRRAAESNAKPGPESKEQAAREPGHGSPVHDATNRARTTPTAERTTKLTQQPAPLRRPSGRCNRTGRERRGARPSPLLRRRSRALRVGPFRRPCDDRYGSGTADAAATSTGRPDAAVTRGI